MEEKDKKKNPHIRAFLQLPVLDTKSFVLRKNLDTA